MSSLVNKHPDFENMDSPITIKSYSTRKGRLYDLYVWRRNYSQKLDSPTPWNRLCSHPTPLGKTTSFLATSNSLPTTFRHQKLITLWTSYHVWRHVLGACISVKSRQFWDKKAGATIGNFYMNADQVSTEILILFHSSNWFFPRAPPVNMVR